MIYSPPTIATLARTNSMHGHYVDSLGLALWASIQTVAHYTPSMSNPDWSYPSPPLIHLLTYIIIIINLLTIPRWTYWSTPLLINYLVWWVAATARSWVRFSFITFQEALAIHSLRSFQTSVNWLLTSSFITFLLEHYITAEFIISFLNSLSGLT